MASASVMVVYKTTVPEGAIYAALSQLKAEFEHEPSALHEKMELEEDRANIAAMTAALNDLHSYWIPNISAANKKGQKMLHSYGYPGCQTFRYRFALKQLLGHRFSVRKGKSCDRAPHTVVYW